MKQITEFTIATDELPATSSVREFVVEADIDAEFFINVIQKSNSSSVLDKFYNWSNKTFQLDFTKDTNLKVKMTSNSYRNKITFPTVSADTTYIITLQAPGDKDTEIIFGPDKKSYRTDLSQLNNTTITFKVEGTEASYTSGSTTATITSSGSPALISNNIVNYSWDLRNAATDDDGFGLRLIRQPLESDFVFITQDTVDGAISPSDGDLGFKVKVDSIENLAVGMIIYSVNSGSLSGTPTITNIDTDTKVLTMNGAQTFADGVVLTFRALGSDVISRAIGAQIDFSLFNVNNTSAVSKELTKTVRTTASGTTIQLDGTYGISGGGFVTISGVNVANSSTNTVQTVSPSSSVGSIVMQVAQTIKEDSTIRFHGSAKEININNKVIIKKYPTASQDIHLLIDNFITPGVSGS